MSATLNAALFADYFSGVVGGGDKGGGHVPIIQVPGRTFPVKRLYLEHALQLSG